MKNESKDKTDMLCQETTRPTMKNAYDLKDIEINSNAKQQEAININYEPNKTTTHTIKHKSIYDKENGKYT